MPTQGLPPFAMTGFVSTTEWRSISGKFLFSKIIQVTFRTAVIPAVVQSVAPKIGITASKTFILAWFVVSDDSVGFI